MSVCPALVNGNHVEVDPSFGYRWHQAWCGLCKALCICPIVAFPDGLHPDQIVYREGKNVNYYNHLLPEFWEFPGTSTQGANSHAYSPFCGFMYTVFLTVLHQVWSMLYYCCWMTYHMANYLFSVKCTNKMLMPTCLKSNETHLSGCLCFCSISRVTPSPAFLFLHYISSRPGVGAATFPAEVELGWSWQSINHKTAASQWGDVMSCHWDLVGCHSRQLLTQNEHMCVFKPFQKARPEQSKVCSLSLPYCHSGCTLPSTCPLIPEGQHFWLTQIEKCDFSG